jgi:hypothetical protein
MAVGVSATCSIQIHDITYLAELYSKVTMQLRMCFTVLKFSINDSK